MFKPRRDRSVYVKLLLLWVPDALVGTGLYGTAMFAPELS